MGMMLLHEPVGLEWRKELFLDAFFVKGGDGFSHFGSKIYREIIHIQLNMVSHHRFIHGLGMLPDERERIVWILKRVFYTAPQDPVYFQTDLLRQIPLDDDASKRNG